MKRYVFLSTPMQPGPSIADRFKFTMTIDGNPVTPPSDDAIDAAHQDWFEECFLCGAAIAKWGSLQVRQYCGTTCEVVDAALEEMGDVPS